MAKEKKKEEACTYNSCVDCPVNDRHCVACGWNPDVYSKRLKKIRMAKPKDVWYYGGSK